MGKKYKKKVQWKQLSLTDVIIPTESEKQKLFGIEDCEEEEDGDSAPQTPTHESSPYPRQPYKPNFNYTKRGGGPHYPHHGGGDGYYNNNVNFENRRFEKNFDRYNNPEHFRNLENRGVSGPPFDKPPFYRNYHHDKFYGGRPPPPFYGDRFKFGGGFNDRGRRPFRPYGRPGGFLTPRGFQGHFRGGSGGLYREGGPGTKGLNGCDGEEEEEEWDEEGVALLTEAQQQQLQQQQQQPQQVGDGSGEKPSQPVHTVLINNEQYTKIQTPRQEVIFKKSSLDRKRDSIDQGSVTGSMSSGSGSSTIGENGTVGDSATNAEQDSKAAGDGSSVAGSMDDTSLSVTGDEPPDIQQQQDQVFEDPNEMFVGEPGGPPLAGVVMQQAYPGGPMVTIPVHWTPFIDPGLIPGETALTPLDPAFTHVIDPKSLPIDPLHILPVQHDASGCPVQVQVKVDSSGVPIQIEPSAFTVSLSSLHHQQQDILNHQEHQHQHLHHHHYDTESLEHKMDYAEEHYEEEEEEEEEEEGEEEEEEEQLTNTCDDESDELEDQHDRLHNNPTTKEEEDTDSSSNTHCHDNNSYNDDDEEESKGSEEDHEDNDKDNEDNDDNVISNNKHEDVEETIEERLCLNEVNAMNGDQQEAESKENKNTSTKRIETTDCTKKESTAAQTGNKRQNVKLTATEKKKKKKKAKLKRQSLEKVQEKEEKGDCGKKNKRHKQEKSEAQEEEQASKRHSLISENSESSVVVEEEAALVEINISDKVTTATSVNTTVSVPSPTTLADIDISSSLLSSSSSSSSHERVTEDEEEIITKVHEEGSDSNDSQYASMSESSSVPTTPAGESSDSSETHDPVESPLKTSSEVSRQTYNESPCDVIVVLSSETEEFTPKESSSAPEKSSSVLEESSSVPEESSSTPEESSSAPEESSSALEESSPAPDTAINAPNSSPSTPVNSSMLSSSSLSPEDLEEVHSSCNSCTVDEATSPPVSDESLSTCENTSIETSEEIPHSSPHLLEGEFKTEYIPSETNPQNPLETNNETEENCEEHDCNVLQGYVMVPILTPYYDPAVIYGYPVVVDQQQHQRAYNKRKKKKFNRRRHADVPAAGGYLDPQLYTGEPFVATPGGYIVPVDAATSVCQVHGFQYMNPQPFHSHHHQHPDEGFVQPPFYFQNVPDLAMLQAQQLQGTSLDDSKTVFGDLQEKERRQIQEILHDQKEEGDKSESVESSDSGVSESEEVVAPELSSDEHDSHENKASASSKNPEIVSETQNLDSSEAEISKKVISCEESLCSEYTENNKSDESSSNISESKDGQLNAQCEVQNNYSVDEELSNLADDQTSVCNTQDSSIHQDSSALQLDTDSVITNDSVNQSSIQDTLSDNENEQICENDIDRNFSQDKSVKFNASENCELHCVESKITESSTSNGENKFDCNLGAQSVTDISLSNQVDKQKEIEEQFKQPDNDLGTLEIPSSEDENLIKEIPVEQECIIEKSAVLDVERINSPSQGGSVEDHSIPKESLKDLKVTEAVKRWIRDVTPEKAFFLSEVAQSRILEEDIEEMDTDDEYIEDEMPQTTESKVTDSKNVKSNPFVAASSDALNMGMDSCSKRVASQNRQRGNTPDTLDDYDGSSTISNLSYDHLYSEESSRTASFSQSFDDEEVDSKYHENPNIYNPVVYAKYYQLGVEIDPTPIASPLQVSRESTPKVQAESETVSECGSEEIETVPHKYDVASQQYTATSPMSLATEILKAEKVLNNMSHITGFQHGTEVSENGYGNPDVFLKHFGTSPHIEVSDSGVQSEESSDEMEARSNVGSSGVGSSLASTPAVSPAHCAPNNKPSLQPHPLKNLSVGDGPVPCRTVCCAVM